MLKTKVVSLLTVILLAGGFSCAPKNEISHSELTQLLDIRRWVVPMPKDRRYEWAFEIRDYKECGPAQKGEESWMDSSRKAEITFMPLGTNSIYRYWFKQTEGTSSGETRIDVCENPDDTSQKCDAGQIETKWYDPPIRIEDGKKYLICQVVETFSPGRKKQVVLVLTKFRLEDMEEDTK